MEGRRLAARNALRIAAIYAFVGALWIIVSDRAASAELLETAKGLAFVGLSAAFLYALMREEFRKHRQLESQLARARDEARQSDRMKASLLANMNHEIRTPLNVLVGYLELLLEDLGGRGTPNDEFFRSIDQAKSRLLETLSKIMDMAKLEGGAYQPIRKDVDLSALVEKQVHHFRVLAAKKSLSVDLENELGPVRIRVDEYALEQALANLLDNAVKFTPQGRILVRLLEFTNGVALEVADTGLGIPHHYLPRIFAPFSQQRSDLTRPFEGSGLGLAITKRFLEANGAWITVDTEVGRGSCFTIRFPAPLVVSGGPVASRPGGDVGAPHPPPRDDHLVAESVLRLVGSGRR